MTIAVEEASGRLAELLEELRHGPITLTRGEVPVAQIVAAEPLPESRPLRKLGTMRGTVLYMAPDFDAPLEDFKDYMQ